MVSRLRTLGRFLPGPHWTAHDALYEDSGRLAVQSIDIGAVKDSASTDNRVAFVTLGPQYAIKAEGRASYGTIPSYFTYTLYTPLLQYT
jgi:hypothetical protein